MDAADFPSEYIAPFTMGIRLLERSRIYFFQGYEKSFFLRYWALLLIIPSSLAFAISLNLYFCKLLAEASDLVEIAATLPIVFITFQGIFKAVIIWSNRKKIGIVIKELSKIWPKNDTLSERQQVMKYMHLRKLDICNKVYYCVNIGGAWQYLLTPLAEIMFRAVIWEEEVKLVLPFGGIFPFDPTKSWLRYGLVYSFQVGGIIKLLYCLLGPELLMITLCAHLSTLFTLLSDDLLNIGPPSSEGSEPNSPNDVAVSQEVRKKYSLKSIVRRHQKLIMFSTTCDDIFNKIIFIDLLFATITSCFFSILSKVAQSPGVLAKNLIGIIATILPIFNLCYYAQLLMDASVELENSAYFNIWYKRDLKYQKMLLFFMIRCRQPCCLTSLRYAPVALRSFTRVMSTTWSYISLVSTVIKEDYY